MLDDFRTLPAPPADVSPGAMLARLVDGLAFRYYWATEGLRPDDGAFRVCEGSMTILEVMQHTWRIANFARHAASPGSPAPGDPPATMAAAREGTLAALGDMRARFLAMTAEEIGALRFHRAGLPEPLPIWNLISGPLADALTHVGQINSWRRAAGNPVTKVNYLLGKPA